ncbi:MAG: hypothetical protein R6X02_32430 [Enhygromyxa sp.]
MNHLQHYKKIIWAGTTLCTAGLLVTGLALAKPAKVIMENKPVLVDDDAGADVVTDDEGEAKVFIWGDVECISVEEGEGADCDPGGTVKLRISYETKFVCEKKGTSQSFFTDPVTEWATLELENGDFDTGDDPIKLWPSDEGACTKGSVETSRKVVVTGIEIFHGGDNKVDGLLIGICDFTDEASEHGFADWADCVSTHDDDDDDTPKSKPKTKRKGPPPGRPKGPPAGRPKGPPHSKG